MQDFKLSYADLVTVLALITSLGAVWRLNRELRKPKDDLVRMVEKHERLLSIRQQRIIGNRKRADMALRCVIELLDAEERADLTRIRGKLMDFLAMEDEEEE